VDHRWNDRQFSRRKQSDRGISENNFLSESVGRPWRFFIVLQIFCRPMKSTFFLRWQFFSVCSVTLRAVANCQPMCFSPVQSSAQVSPSLAVVWRLKSHLFCRVWWKMSSAWPSTQRTPACICPVTTLPNRRPGYKHWWNWWKRNAQECHQAAAESSVSSHKRPTSHRRSPGGLTCPRGSRCSVSWSTCCCLWQQQ